MGLDPRYRHLVDSTSTIVSDLVRAKATRTVVGRVEMTPAERYEMLEMLGLIKIDDEMKEEVEA